MGVPTSEVGYTPAMPRREDHEVHNDMQWQWGGGGIHTERIVHFPLRKWLREYSTKLRYKYVYIACLL